MIRTPLPKLMEAASPLRGRVHLPMAFRYPDYRNYWLGLLASVTGYQMLVNFSLLWLIYEITQDARYEGYVGVAIAVPAIVLNLFGGVFADKLNPKRLVGLAQLSTAVVAAALAMLAYTGIEHVEPWPVLVAAFFIGAGQAFDTPSRQSMWPRLIERKALHSAVALHSVVWTGTRIVAPTIAGIIIGRAGITTAILVSASGFLILSLVAQTLTLPPVERAKGRVFSEMLAGFMYIKASPTFSFLIGMSFFNSMFGMSYIFLMPVFVKEVLEVGAEKIGWLLGASGVGALTGTFIVIAIGRRQYQSWMLIGGAVIFGLFLMLFGFTTHLKMYELSMLVLFFAGVFNSIYLLSLMTTLQSLIDDQFRGRVMGFYTITWSMAALGALQASFIAHYTNAPLAVAVGGGMAVAFSLGMAMVSPRVRSLGALIAEHSDSTA